MTNRAWDAVVVGAGPAGLSAALWLARYRRRVLAIDDARPRNEAAWAVHGFPGLADVAPAELRRRLRDQARTAGAVVQHGRVLGVGGEKDDFVLERAEDGPVRTRRVVLAYGRMDRVPDIPGVAELYGTAVHHCPDCDGPSVVGCSVGVLGHDRSAAALGLYLLTWAERVTLLTNGLELDVEPSARDVLKRNGVEVRTEPVRRVDGTAGRVHRVMLSEGEADVDALFFHWGSDPSSELGPRAGCRCDDSGDLHVDARTLETSVPGVYAAGDIVGRPYLAVSAAAEGVRAALSVHRSLLPPDWNI